MVILSGALDTRTRASAVSFAAALLVVGLVSAATLATDLASDTLVKLGKVPAKVGAEIYYYVEQDDDFGPEWQLRLIFSPVLPAPGFSRQPWFGK